MYDFFEYTPPMWRNLNIRELKVDEAYFYLHSALQNKLYLYTLSDECYTCPLTKTSVIHPANNNSNSEGNIIKLNVARGIQFRIYDKDVGRYAFENETAICELYDDNMQEFGVYNLTIQQNGYCDLKTDREGVNANLSILTVFLLTTGILLAMKIGWCAWRSYVYQRNSEEDPIEIVNNAASPSSSIETISSQNVNDRRKRRLRSLDAFRGIAIVLMIFVNSGGGDYWWIEHATWNGLHIADVVFPSFLWIMGVCIPISIKAQLQSHSKWQICNRIIWRSFKLFGIGLCLNSLNGPQMEDLRIMGVLQRFGIAYLICGLVHLCFAKKDFVLPQANWKRRFYDLYMFKGEYALLLAFIVLHLSIVLGLNVPNCPKGYLGPGGKHAMHQYPNCTGGAIGYIDVSILGNAHIYQHPTAKTVYDSGAFDPEGIFGCILTCVQVFYGVLAGVVILVHSSWKSRIIRWVSWSVALGLIGSILCSFSKEAGPIPINKNLWSLSFVFVTTSLAFLVLSLLYFIIDVVEWWIGSPFVESGMNAIIMYVGHTVMHKMLPWHWRIGSMNTHFILLTESTWNTLLWIAIALYLDYKKIYLSL